MNDLKGLQLVFGNSKETIEIKLRNAGIKYHLLEDTKRPFFRKHNFYVNSFWDSEQKIFEGTDKSKIISILGWPDYYQLNDLHYYAKYEIKEEFDYSKLNGKITYCGGLLLESTRVYCKH